ncbi:TadE/TadG family type IV pilus assembly protein [Sinomonas humi]|nr:TadE/TadG family type IV pilus assembly protein [Sinomonas humi]
MKLKGNGRTGERHSRERGAAAVEFALVVPILIALVFGIIEFSHLYNAQIELTNAARVAARTMAVDTGTNPIADGTAAANAMSPGYSISVTYSPSTCAAGSQVKATATAQIPLLTGSWFGLKSPIAITGIGAMRCGG